VKDLLVLLGKRVHDLRMAKNWSQEEFAAVAGLHRTYIGQIERGEKNLSFGNLVKISTVLGVSPSNLLSALDGDDAHHLETSRKQEGSRPRSVESARRVHEIHKLLKRLRQQRNVMDQTMVLLETVASAGKQPVSSASSRAAKRNSSKRSRLV
jgi:transcriptional regulator with XRE-family HTH domain